MTVTLLLVVSATLGYIILCLRKNWLSDFSEICLLSLGSYIGQGMDLEHQKNLSSRVAIQSLFVQMCAQNLLLQQVLFITQLFCGITLLALFSARLTSILAKHELEPLVKNLDDVYNNDLNLYIHGRSMVMLFMS